MVIPQTAILLLALVGGIALARELFRAAALVALKAAEGVAASGAAEAGLRRGDLTALSEGQAIRLRARGQRRKNAALGFLWLLWLTVPLALGEVPIAYAIASPLWLLGGHRRSQKQRASATENGTDPVRDTDSD